MSEINPLENTELKSQSGLPKGKKLFKNFSFKRAFKRLTGGKQNFFIRKGTEVTVIVHEKNHTLYATENKNIPKNKLFLFKMVKNDVKKYISENPFIILPPQQKTQNYNMKYNADVGVITGTDLNHAYWRIAFVKGYISKKTYEKGLEDENSKTVRLATLGVLGKERKYDEYRNGEYFTTIIERKEDKAMLLVYKDIRYTCYQMMYVLSLKLGDDFESWQTDCIYYRDSLENRKLVHSFFDAHKLSYKQLSFDVEFDS